VPATSAGVAICVPPSKSVKLPVGVPPPDVGATFIFSVNICPVASWVADGITVVVVAVFAGAETVTVTALEVDAAKSVSPAYAAVTLCEPNASVDVINVATPEARFAVPMELAPSLKVTVPVGVPEPDFGATVAVNVTLCPVVICILDAASDVVEAARVAEAGVKTKTVAEYAGKL
jgi:hypothetical protein